MNRDIEILKSSLTSNYLYYEKQCDRLDQVKIDLNELGLDVEQLKECKAITEEFIKKMKVFLWGLLHGSLIAVGIVIGTKL